MFRSAGIVALYQQLPMTMEVVQTAASVAHDWVMVAWKIVPNTNLDILYKFRYIAISERSLEYKPVALL